MLSGPSAIAALPATCRAVPIGSIGAVASVGLVPTVITAARGGTDFTFAYAFAAVVGGAGLAYAIDDTAAVLLASSPTSLWWRRAGRVSVGALVAISAWLGVLAVGVLAGAFEGVPMRSLALEAFAAAGIAVGSATLVVRRGLPDRAGITGVTASILTMLSIAGLAQHWQWLPGLGPHTQETRWLWVAALGWGATLVASRDPVARRRTTQCVVSTRTRAAAVTVGVAALAVCAAGIWGHGQFVTGHQSDARAGSVPWALAGFFAATAGEVVVVRRTGVGGRGVLARGAGALLTSSLVALMLFFTGVGATGRYGPSFVRGDNAFTALITLAVSVLLLVALPMALVLFAIAIARDRRLRWPARLAPSGVIATSVIGAAVFAAAPESTETAIVVVWVLAVAAAWLTLGFGAS